MVVRRLKPKPVFSDPNYREDRLRKVNEQRISRPDAVFKYPFRDDRGTVDDVFNCDIVTTMPDFCCMGLAARKRLAKSIFQEMCIGSKNTATFVTRMKISDVPEALKQLGFNVGVGLREAFISIGTGDPSKMSVVTEDQWQAIVHRFVYAELRRRKAKREAAAAVTAEPKAKAMSPDRSPKTVAGVSGEYPLCSKEQKRCPPQPTKFDRGAQLQEVVIPNGLGWVIEDDNNVDGDNGYDGTNEIDIEEWESTGDNWVSVSDRPIKKQLEDEKLAVALLLDETKSSSLAAAKKKKALASGVATGKGSVKRYAVKEEQPPKIYVPKSAQTIHLPKEIKRRPNTAESKIREAVRADRGEWMKNDHAERSSAMLAIAKERVRKIVSKSKFRPEDAYMFNPETGVLEESFFSDSPDAAVLDDEMDYENFITGRASFTKRDKIRPSIAKSVTQAASIAGEFPDKFSFDIVDSFLQSGFSEKYLNVPLSLPRKPSDVYEVEKDGPRLIPEGWRQKHGGWVGDFGPVHTHSSLSKKKAAEIAGMYKFDDRFDRREEGEVASRSGTRTATGNGADDSKISGDDDVSESIGEFSTVDINRY